VGHLTRDQLVALARGELRLTLSEPVRAPRGASAARPSPRPPDSVAIRAQLVQFQDRAGAVRHLDELGLTVAQLHLLARDLGIAVASSATKAAVRDTIIQWTVGRRIDAAVLSRPSPAGQ
jgi:hypothetical protein